MRCNCWFICLIKSYQRAVNFHKKKRERAVNLPYYHDHACRCSHCGAGAVSAAPFLRPSMGASRGDHRRGRLRRRDRPRGDSLSRATSSVPLRPPQESAAEAAAAATITALQARAESGEKDRRDLLLRARAVEEGHAAAEVVSRRAEEVTWSLEVWRRALDEQAGHFTSAVSPGGEVEAPLPPPPAARRHRWSCSVRVDWSICW